MSSTINVPPVNSNLPLDAEGTAARWTGPWGNWFSQAYRILFAEAESGTTANRPTKNLYIGRSYFDVSLGAHGKKIFVDKDLTGWVDSSGNVV